MPLRPDLPAALNLSRRTTAPVKLPRMSFPMVGGIPESVEQPVEDSFEPLAPTPEDQPGAPEYRHAPAASPSAEPVTESRESTRVIVYGRSGSQACLEAVQDLLDRQTSFAYYDVDRDVPAREHLQAICGGDPVVPVIVYIGFRAR